jgi:hypothetical protein
MPSKRARKPGSDPVTKPEGPPQHFPVEIVPLASLKPHPRNYRVHPADQLAHIVASIEQHGIYRNVVIAQDSTILAGHGVTQALAQLQRETVAVIRLPIDPESVAALKVLASDNEIGHLAEVDDKTFTALMLDIAEMDTLLGSYDAAMLQNLMFITSGQTRTDDEAGAWAAAGMPGDLNGPPLLKLIIGFDSEKDRATFVEKYQLRILKHEAVVWSTRWPDAQAYDYKAIRFEAAGAAADGEMPV